MMLTEGHLKLWLSILLQAGIYISVGLVLTGGVGLLWTHGGESLQNSLLSSTTYNIDILTIWDSQHLFSSLGLIDLGLLVLVATQVLRVALLGCYYTIIRDYWYMLFSFFILTVILYSLIWQ